MRRTYVLLTTIGLVGCPDFGDVCTDPSCLDGGDASNDSAIDAPPGCDSTADPKDASACVVDGFGIFVDSGGKDTNSGTKAAPVQTITHALDVAKQNKGSRIYVCEGSYNEDVTIDANHDGISMFGGWKCTDWSYSGNKPAIGKSSLAMKVDSLTQPIRVQDLLVKSAAATANGASSVAVFVVGSASVALARVNLTAGAGKDGVSGVLNSLTFPNPATDLQGNTATDGTGATQKSYTCLGGSGVTIGGKGGDGSGGDGDPGLPANGGGAKGLGGAQSVACTNGSDGNAGGLGPNAPGPTSIGVLDNAGWQSAKGADGTVGGAGQGGGGGGGRTFNTVAGGGGSGGAGGCGGGGGGGGEGGGGSIALIAFNSTVTLSASELHATAAGNGGAGIAGQLGQNQAGVHGAPFSSGCLGGNGGIGGNGGSGAGGAGGISVGALWKGAIAPTVDSSTTTNTTFGPKGTKGTGGTPSGNDGVDGFAQAALQAP